MFTVLVGQRESRELVPQLRMFFVPAKWSFRMDEQQLHSTIDSTPTSSTTNNRPVYFQESMCFVSRSPFLFAGMC